MQHDYVTICIRLNFFSLLRNHLILDYSYYTLRSKRPLRQHRMHAVHRCGLLLQMSHVAWSVCLCVVTRIGYAKTAQPIEMPFNLGLTYVGSRNHLLDADPFTIPFTRPFTTVRGRYAVVEWAAHCKV